MGRRQQASEATLAKVNEILLKRKSPEEKLAFLMGLNSVFGSPFHINDNSFLELNEDEKKYFDAFYTMLLLHINEDIKVNGLEKRDLIAKYEKSILSKSLMLILT